MRKLSAVIAMLLLLSVWAVPSVSAETTVAPAAPTVAQTTTTTAAPQTEEMHTAVESMQIFQKTYSLHMDQYRGEIVSDTNAAAFWEYPVFEPGQTYTVTGILVVRNDSEMTANVRLDNVSLPYGDTKRMAYLNHLMLTVKEVSTQQVETVVTQPTAAEVTVATATPTDPTAAETESATTATTAVGTIQMVEQQVETVLFDGAYAHINDPEGGLKLVYNNMAPGEEHTYHITMRCLYSYDGDPYEDSSWLRWNFTADHQSSGVYIEEHKTPEWVWMTLNVLVATVALMVLIMIIVAIVTFVKNRFDRKEARAERKEARAAKKAEKLADKEEAKRRKEEFRLQAEMTEASWDEDLVDGHPLEDSDSNETDDELAQDEPIEGDDAPVEETEEES